MSDYRYAHNLKELNELSKKGYEFLSVVDPNTFLMVYEEPLHWPMGDTGELGKLQVFTEGKPAFQCPDCAYIATGSTEGKAKNTLRLHSKKHGPATN